MVWLDKYRNRQVKSFSQRPWERVMAQTWMEAVGMVRVEGIRKHQKGKESTSPCVQPWELHRGVGCEILKLL